MQNDCARSELEQGCDLEEKGELERAFKFYFSAAKHGSVEAQVNLANLYDEGRGCQRDARQAVYWYKRAIKSGSAEAAYNLGVHYRQLGQPRWARYWLEKAANMGDEDACVEVVEASLEIHFPGAM